MGRIFDFFRSRPQVDSESVDTTAQAEGLVSSEGLGVSVSVGGRKSERPNFFDNETLSFEEVPEHSLMFKECGHEGAQEFKFNIWGNARGKKLKDKCIKQENGVATTDGICPKCYFEKIKKATIRCCLCGNAILPGDGIALYHKSSENIRADTATFVGDSAVGCLLWDCCPSGGFFAGHWTFEGFESAFDVQSAAGKAFSTGQPVITNV